MTDIDVMAYRLALHHIRRDVEQGMSEYYIASTWHGSGRGHKHWHDAPDGFGGGMTRLTASEATK